VKLTPAQRLVLYYMAFELVYHGSGSPSKSFKEVRVSP
jgi:hypothetical protein